MFKILLNEHNKMSLGSTLLVSNYKANEDKKNDNNKNENDKNDKQYHFAVCKTCFWTATLLRIKRTINNDISNYDSKSISCPVCFDHQSISLIPLMVH
jgi:hypothetical protein